jgi:hypothetical protein
MKTAVDRFTDEELHIDRIDRGDGFVGSPFVQFQVRSRGGLQLLRQAERLPEGA